MIKRIAFVLSLSLLMVSCGNKTSIIPQKKMTQILLDLHLAESLAQHIPKDSLQTELKNKDSLNYYTAQIFKRNNISNQDFQTSMNYYKDHPEQLDSMYQIILAKIAVMQTLKK